MIKPKTVLAMSCIFCLLICGFDAPSNAFAVTNDASATQPAQDQALDAAVAGAWRAPANKARDIYRHPLETLTFWGLKPGDTIVEIDPGVKGWWTEILAPYVRATGGAYIAALPDRYETGLTDQAKADRGAAYRAFQAGVADQSLYGKVQAVDFGPQAVNSIPDNSADLVLVARAFHNWAREPAPDGGTVTGLYLKAFFRVLKPGGILAVEQHRAPEGFDPTAGTGYVPESYVISAAEKAGFVLDGRSEINANPKDTKDYPYGVWTLPPTRKGPAAGATPPAGYDRAKYDSIGESDRMTLRFRKPHS